MINIVKQAVGIDIGKDEFVVRFGSKNQKDKLKFTRAKTFKNNKEGFALFNQWVKEQKDKKIDAPVFIMEATGVYYENLAFYLSAKKQRVVVILPSKSKRFAQSLDIKSKTDAIDAKILAQLALERNLETWNVPDINLRHLKELCREYGDNKNKCRKIMNQLHAKKESHQPNKRVISRLKAQLRVLEKQRIDIEGDLQDLVDESPAIKKQVEYISSIPGLAFISAVILIAETHGFVLFKNARQLTSYAGLDVVHRQSGNKEGKSYISKKGNWRLRAALYMPAMVAAAHNPNLKPFYERLKNSKVNGKIGVTAVARKMLTLAFTLCKNNTFFNPNYKTGQAHKRNP